MPELGKYYAGDWLKIRGNVNAGDNIRFTNGGKNEGSEADPKWVFLVEVIQNGEVASERKFTLNKTNFGAVSSLYGTNSDKWVGKEMRVNEVEVRNPKTGQKMPSIELSAPGTNADGDVLYE